RRGGAVRGRAAIADFSRSARGPGGARRVRSLRGVTLDAHRDAPPENHRAGRAETIPDPWIGPRERAPALGVETLGDAELLAIVLGTGRAGLPVSVLAVLLLEEHGGVGGLARAGV